MSKLKRRSKRLQLSFLTTGVKMGFLAALSGISGSFFSEAKDLINDYFPPDMSESEKASLKIKLDEIEAKSKSQSDTAILEAEKEFNKRMADHEGTAGDLRQMPFLGRPILFLRGVQRPAWGFFTMYLDNAWLFSTSSFTDRQETALMVINVLVLGFLFGERTIKNLTPLIVRVFGGGKVAK